MEFWWIGQQMLLSIMEFSSLECGHITDIDLPDHGSILTPEDNIPITVDCEGINYDLVSSDGRQIQVEDDEIVFSSPGNVGVIGIITGTISCDVGTPIDIRHEFEILGNIPIETSFESYIPVIESTSLDVPVELVGDSSQTWLIGIDGALSRIATTDSSMKLSEGSSIPLNINPEGLLQEGMYVKGQIIIASDSGHRYTIEVELIAGDEEDSTFEEWTSPAKLIPIALVLSALWVALGISSPTRQVPTDEQEVPSISVQSDDPSFVDPFGESY